MPVNYRINSHYNLTAAQSNFNEFSKFDNLQNLLLRINILLKKVRYVFVHIRFCFTIYDGNNLSL